MTTLLEYDVRMPEAHYPQPDPESRPDVEFELIDPLSGPTWDGLALSHREATIFHSAAWARVLTKTYDHTPLYFRATRGDMQALVPLMEVKSRITGRRGVCLPFSDFCEPLYFGEPQPSVVAERLAAMAVERRWDYFEIRGECSPQPALQFYGHQLDLRPGAQALLAGCSSAVRRAIRKAEKSGLVAECSRSWDSMFAFYQLHVRTRRRHGLPPQPLTFFRNIFKEIIEPGLGFVARATLDSRCLAAAVFLQFGRRAIYKFGASSLRWQQLRGNNLVMWTGIARLAEGSCEFLDFGRTSRGNGNLRRFKMGWGAREEIIKYGKWNTSPGAWTTSRDRAAGGHNQLFSHLPFVLNRLAGYLLYPHLD